MNTYYVEIPYYPHHHAGGKLRNDYNSILKELDFIPLNQHSILNSEDIVFIQYSFTNSSELELLKRLSFSGVQTVLLINDIVSLNRGNLGLISYEVSIFNQCSYLIVHNEKMKKWLKEQGVITPMYSLELFDYFMSEEDYQKIKSRMLSNQVVFTGNLNSAVRSFFYDGSYEHEYQLNLYGPELNKVIKSQHTVFKGNYTPEEVPTRLEGSFGLHWNGGSKEGCEGRFGFYSTIATAHKISLYLLAGLPIICWEGASEAYFIKEHHLGFLIKSLDEIDEKIATLDEADYQIMRQHILPFSKRIHEHYYFKRAIFEVIQHLEDSFK